MNTQSMSSSRQALACTAPGHCHSLTRAGGGRREASGSGLWDVRCEVVVTQLKYAPIPSPTTCHLDGNCDRNTD